MTTERTHRDRLGADPRSLLRDEEEATAAGAGGGRTRRLRDARPARSRALPRPRACRPLCRGAVGIDRSREQLDAAVEASRGGGEGGEGEEGAAIAYECFDVREVRLPRTRRPPCRLGRRGLAPVAFS